MRPSCRSPPCPGSVSPARSIVAVGFRSTSCAGRTLADEPMLGWPLTKLPARETSDKTLPCRGLDSGAAGATKALVARVTAGRKPPWWDPGMVARVMGPGLGGRGGIPRPAAGPRPSLARVASTTTSRSPCSRVLSSFAQPGDPDREHFLAARASPKAAFLGSITIPRSNPKDGEGPSARKINVVESSPSTYSECDGDGEGEGVAEVSS